LKERLLGLQQLKNEFITLTELNEF